MLENKKEEKIHTVSENIQITEPIYYKRKGYGKIISYFIIIIFFLFTPELGKIFWPRKLPENFRLFNYLIILITHHSIFIVCNLTLYFIYKSESPFFERYKIHNEIWPWKKDNQQWIKLLKETAYYLFINQFIISSLANLIVFLREKPIIRMEFNELPNCFELLWQMNFLIICEDFFFYWSHRFLHIKQLYPYIHKIHHKFTNTIGISAENAHPIEFLLGNILPTQSGVLILGNKIHLYTNLLWIFIRVIKTTDAHSGYDFSWSPFSKLPFFSCSDFHNFHHLKYKGNYGSFLTIWDTLCGTVNKEYKIFKNKREKFENFIEKEEKKE